MAALINDEFGVGSDLVEGDRGEFTVWVGGQRVAEKDANGFPAEEEVLSAVQTALAT